MSADRVLVEMIIAAPIDRVWDALRNRAQIAEWFGWEYPEANDSYEMIESMEPVITGQTRVLKAGVFTDHYVVEPYDAERTVVRVIRSAPADDPSWTGVYDDLSEGWLTFTQQLRFLLERAPKLPRRTLFLNGRARAAGEAPPVQALGLGSLVTAGVGEKFSLKIATGETLSGEVWYRSVYQLGVTVKEFGDGLLIANTRTTTAKSPHGGGTLLLTTYGLSDAARKSLLERWPAWWKKTYEVIEIQPAE